MLQKQGSITQPWRVTLTNRVRFYLAQPKRHAINKSLSDVLTHTSMHTPGTWKGKPSENSPILSVLRLSSRRQSGAGGTWSLMCQGCQGRSPCHYCAAGLFWHPRAHSLEAWPILSVVAYLSSVALACVVLWAGQGDDGKPAITDGLSSSNPVLSAWEQRKAFNALKKNCLRLYFFLFFSLHFFLIWTFVLNRVIKKTASKHASRCICVWRSLS